jgi:hypothetical protein
MGPHNVGDAFERIAFNAVVEDGRIQRVFEHLRAIIRRFVAARRRVIAHFQ